MTLSDAKVLRDEIRSAGLHCTIPTGSKNDHAPEYAPRIITRDGLVSFMSRKEWLAYKVGLDERRERDARRGTLPRPRSAMDLMIDKACGIEEADYEQ